jgi:tetratricopeptide (TPR) repeat protein
MASNRMKETERHHILVVAAGDLAQERKLLPGIARRFNAAADEKISFSHWTTDPPPTRRSDIAACDLVVFLLWKRWGPPSGKYSSEFKRVFAEAENAGLPCLFYFRTVPDVSMVAPGRDISRIIGFRDEIEKRSDVGCFWYDDPDRWKNTILDHLDQWADGDLPHQQLVADLSDHKKRLAGLIRTLNKAKSKRPLGAFRTALKAYSLAEKNRFTQACRQFAKAIAEAREPYLINEYGILLKRNGLWITAERTFEDLARLGQFLEDKLVIGSAMRHLGDINRRADRPERADRFLRRAAAAERDSGRSLKAAAIQQERGMLHYKLGHLNTAQKLLAEALKIYEQADSLEGQAIIYFSLTGIHIEKAQMAAAMHTGQKALDLFRRIGADEMIDRLQTLLKAVGEDRNR